MSRSNYTNYDEYMVLWRGTVTRALGGKRGQAFLKEVLTALDAMPIKRLIVEDLIDDVGEVCALGSIGAARGIDLSTLDPYDHASLSTVFGIARCMVQEIEYENDEGGHWQETPEHRFERIRAWVTAQIKP